VTLVTAGTIGYVENVPRLENNRLFQFPLKFGEWVGVNIFMNERIFESLETEYAILREYRGNDGREINFTIVWYDDKEIAFHSAAACLGGVGDRVTADEEMVITARDGRPYHIARLVTEKYDQGKVVYYYYVNYGHLTGSQLEARKSVVLKRLMFQRTSTAFIRIMTSVGGDAQSAEKDLKAFFEDSLPLVLEYTTAQKNQKGSAQE